MKKRWKELFSELLRGREEIGTACEENETDEEWEAITEEEVRRAIGRREKLLGFQVKFLQGTLIPGDSK